MCHQIQLSIMSELFSSYTFSSFFFCPRLFLLEYRCVTLLWKTACKRIYNPPTTRNRSTHTKEREEKKGNIPDYSLLCPAIFIELFFFLLFFLFFSSWDLNGAPCNDVLLCNDCAAPLGFPLSLGDDIFI